MRKINNHQYQKYADSKIKKSPLIKNTIWAFLTGGAICVLGQGFFDLFSYWGISQKESYTLVSITLIFLSALLTAVGKYDNLAKHAGAGTLVPITGFANAVASPSLEFKNEGFITGTCANMFKIAGPVIVYGILSAFAGGIIYYFFGG